MSETRYVGEASRRESGEDFGTFRENSREEPCFSPSVSVSFVFIRGYGGGSLTQWYNLAVNNPAYTLDRVVLHAK